MQKKPKRAEMYKRETERKGKQSPSNTFLGLTEQMRRTIACMLNLVEF
jgi:hypothetical protein